MKITITGRPKEIAALVDEIQERRVRREELRCVNHLLEEIKLADCGPTIEKLGDPIPISDTEQRSLESRFDVFQDPGKYVEEPRRL